MCVGGGGVGVGLKIMDTALHPADGGSVYGGPSSFQ